MSLSKIMIFTLLTTFIFSTPSHACSPLPADGVISEWVENRVIFWGRAIETKRTKDYQYGQYSHENYTYFEVLESLKGDLPKQIKVYHSIMDNTCGTTFQKDEIQIFAVSQFDDDKHFITGLWDKEPVFQHVLAAYFEENIDVEITEWQRSIIWPIADYDPCAIVDLRTEAEPYFCKWRGVFDQSKENYNNKKINFETNTGNK